MKPLLHKVIRASIAAGLSLLVWTSAGAQEDTVGIVRITKPSTRAVMSPQVTPASFQPGQQYLAASAMGGCPEGCQTGHGDASCPYHSDGMGGTTNTACWACRANHFWGCHRCCHQGCCREDCGQAMCDYFRCKFGYFIPSGAGGAGVPWVGKYSRVYPQDPHYFDQRDGQTWAAQGYGAPIAVPLAPVVGHSYNYGWGIPSSRLTPISHPAY